MCTAHERGGCAGWSAGNLRVKPGVILAPLRHARHSRAVALSGGLIWLAGLLLVVFVLLLLFG